MGRLFVVGTPIGNLGEMTPRAVETLQACESVAAEDTRETRKLLTHFNIRSRLVSYHKFNERTRAEELVDHLVSGEGDLALVSDAGTPGISDPGYVLVRLARERGVPVFGVSGPSAIAVALSISGLPATPFAFHGFLEGSACERREQVRRLGGSGLRTHVLYESPKRIRNLAALVQAELPGTEACFCCELTKLYERSYFGPIDQVVPQLESDPNAERGEYTVVLHTLEPPPADGAAGVVRSAEALLVEAMVTEGLSPRDAVKRVVEQHHLPRKEVYAASLRLRSLLGAPDAEA